ncbi:MAG: hypothetical protein Q8S73_06570, partial [Deltaproteobacteria bacterium]|nr:hypothetical protein [Deltaproteobacteria bacterium]
MQRHTALTALAALTLVAASGCAPVDGDDTASTESTQSIGTARCPESVTTDRLGQPRNAAGQIRQCWPGEARCFCDADQDCYALADHSACTPIPAPTLAAPLTRDLLGARVAGDGPTRDGGVAAQPVGDSGSTAPAVRDGGVATPAVRDGGVATPA